LQELSGSEELGGSAAPAAAAALVLEESQGEVAAAVEYGQQHLIAAYPGLPQLVSSWETAVAVVRAQEEFVNKVVAAGGWRVVGPLGKGWGRVGGVWWGLWARGGAEWVGGNLMADGRNYESGHVVLW
jgi:hypothetical protein